LRKKKADVDVERKKEAYVRYGMELSKSMSLAKSDFQPFEEVNGQSAVPCDVDAEDVGQEHRAKG